MTRSRVVVLVAFASNAFMNVVLLGYFSRIGGLELVGEWSLLMAINMNALILDLGMTNGLTYRIGRDGLSAVIPSLKWLLRLAFWIVPLLLVGAVGAYLAGLPFAAAAALTVAAATLQLASNWMIAIRMGQHQQYWFNGKTILRVFVQSGCAVLFVWVFAGQVFVGLGLAFLVGSIAEWLLAWRLTSRDLASPVRPDTAGLRELVRGFGLENAAQRAFQPMSQLLVRQMLDSAALGTFAIALRIPVVVGQSISEALRGLLPGVAEMLRTGLRDQAVQLLRGSVVSQIVFIFPAAIFILFFSNTLLAVWIGDTNPELVVAVRIFMLAMMVESLAAPFFWASQAAGAARLIAYATMLRLVLVLVVGFASLWQAQSLISFVFVYALGQVGHALACVYVAHRHENLVVPSLRGVRWLRLLSFLTLCCALNGALFVFIGGFGPFLALGIVAMANAVVVLPFVYLSIRKHVFVSHA